MALSNMGQLSPHPTQLDLDSILDDVRVRLDGDERSTAANVGTAVHIVIQALVPLAPSLDQAQTVELVLRLSNAICAPGRSHRTNSTHVAGFAAEYLRGHCLPAAPWRCIATEHRAGAGRVDLVWEHAETNAVVYDEVKTTSVARRVCDPAWLEQAVGYARSGAEDHGKLFVGVRVLPLGSMNVATLVAADGSSHLIAPRSVDPVRHRGGKL